LFLVFCSIFLVVSVSFCLFGNKEPTFVQAKPEWKNSTLSVLEGEVVLVGGVGDHARYY